MHEKHKQIISVITKKTNTYNLDNITRTIAYQQYYYQNKEIKWAFLASMVSRNAGWNMADLEGEYFSKVLSKEKRRHIFYTYEKANWLIFHDAFPQLLIYEYSKKMGESLFHLLPLFHISSFMITEWQRFWEEKDEQRLMTALIINEQWTIQKPVIEHPFFSQHVFSSAIYKVQELFHLSYVLFPTLTGEVFGCCVTKFKKVEKRIELGKCLGQVLFYPCYYSQFYSFSLETVHTGSRFDYEQYFTNEGKAASPILREVYPIISHRNITYEDWHKPAMNVEQYFSKGKRTVPQNITKQFIRRQKQMHLLIKLLPYNLSHEK